MRLHWRFQLAPPRPALDPGSTGTGADFALPLAPKKRGSQPPRCDHGSRRSTLFFLRGSFLFGTPGRSGSPARTGETYRLSKPFGCPPRFRKGRLRLPLLPGAHVCAIRGGADGVVVGGIPSNHQEAGKMPALLVHPGLMVLLT